MAKNKIFVEKKVVTFKGQSKNSEPALNLDEAMLKEAGESSRKNGGQQSRMLQKRGE